jgi:hypothetical protein
VAREHPRRGALEWAPALAVGPGEGTGQPGPARPIAGRVRGRCGDVGDGATGGGSPAGVEVRSVSGMARRGRGHTPRIVTRSSTAMPDSS